MRKTFAITTLLGVLWITGCQNSVGQENQATTAPSNTSITASPIKVSTIPSETAFPLPITQTPIYPFHSKFVKNCIVTNDKPLMLEDITSDGTIILFSEGTEDLGVAQDLKTGKEYKIPFQTKEKYYGGLGVSPDGNKLAYTELFFDNGGRVTKSILWIVNARGDLLQKATFEISISKLRWLDNERMIFYLPETYETGRVLVVNPFKHEQHYVLNDLPAYYSGGILWWIVWLVEYSPDLEWAIYYGGNNVKIGDDEHLGTNNGWTMLVRDINQKKTVWKGPVHDYGTLAWSPDGSQIAVTTYTNEEIEANLHLIDRQGVTKSVLNENTENVPVSPAWSPDGHYIAFWNKNNLMVYDLQTDQVIDLCISIGDGSTILDPPRWAPDSQKFIVPDRILVNLQENTASKLKNSFSAWMNSIP